MRTIQTSRRQHPEDAALGLFREPWMLNAARNHLLEAAREARSGSGPEETRAKKAVELVDLEIAAVDALTRLAEARRQATASIEKEPWV